MFKYRQENVRNIVEIDFVNDSHRMKKKLQEIHQELNKFEFRKSQVSA